MTSPALVLALFWQAATPTPSPSPAADPWAAVRFLVGEWDGTSEGQPGKGTVKRTYRFVLGDRFIHEQNVSTYPPQDVNPKGEVHEHWSFLSRDRARKTYVLRQFHQEGFVNQFAMLPATSASPLVFESEALENVPKGWKARETYEIVSPDEFVEPFRVVDGRQAVRGLQPQPVQARRPVAVDQQPPPNRPT